MAYRFESLRVWQSALAYDDLVCELAKSLPWVAAQHLVRRRGYVTDPETFDAMYDAGEELFRQFQAFRAAIQKRLDQPRRRNK